MLSINLSINTVHIVEEKGCRANFRTFADQGGASAQTTGLDCEESQLEVDSQSLQVKLLFISKF